MRSEFEKLLCAFGSQLYHLDTLLCDCFKNRFSYDYTTLSCYNDETRQERKEIEEIRESLTITDLLKKIIKQCDYYTLYSFKWLINDYSEKYKNYEISTEPTLKMEWFNEDFKIRESELKSLKLDNWRRSNIKELHDHYWFWIKHLKEDENCNYVTWVFKYSDTHMFDMFHLSNYGNKEIMNIVFDYIIENNIIPDQTERKPNFEIIHPMFNNIDFKYSSDMGGMWYAIYLTAGELQEIYAKIGSRKARNLGCHRFFAYVNSLKNEYELNARFYFYFQGK